MCKSDTITEYQDKMSKEKSMEGGLIKENMQEMEKNKAELADLSNKQ